MVRTNYIILGSIGIFISLTLVISALPRIHPTLGIAQPKQALIEVYFAPWDEITPKIVSEVNQAKKTIHGSVYGLTNKTIADALIAKDKSGVQVILGEDKLQSQGKADLHDYLQKNGVDVIIKKTSALEHNKWLVIDGQTTLEGSFNFSQNAQKQDNSFLILRSKEIADKFEQDWKKIMERDR